MNYVGPRGTVRRVEIANTLLTFAGGAFVVTLAVLLPFVFFQALRSSARRAGLPGPPSLWALSACVIGLIAAASAPGAWIPFPLRVHLSAASALFPDLRERGFDGQDVPRLIEAMGTDSSHRVQVEAQRILLAMGPPVVPHMIEALESSDPAIRGGAIVVMAPIGEPARPAIGPVIELLEGETAEQVQIFAFGFLIRAYEWGEPRTWTADALPVAASYLSRSGDIPGYAATTIGAFGSDGARLLRDLRTTLEARIPEGRDAFVPKKLFFAISSICSSLGDAGTIYVECRALAQMKK